MKRWLWRVSVIAAATLAGGRVLAAGPYDGHSVVRVDTTSEAELNQVLALTDDVWSEAVGIGPIDVRVSPSQKAALLATGLRVDTLIADVGALIAQQQLAPRTGPPFEAYADLAGIVAYMNGLAAARPDLASVTSIGTSIEGRPITMIHVHAPGAPANRRAVFYNGCQHAREWISPTVPLYLADHLVKNYDADPAIRALLSRVSFYLVPIVNVDGYAYSWTPNNRLWRKNRRNNGDGTFGVDINRNWGFGWGSNNGSSGTPSNETYRGTAAFSEPETAALRDYFVAHPEIISYIDFHSYSQLTMWPWGYTNVLPPDQATFAPAGAALQNLIFSVLGTYHAIGPIYTAIYPVSGGSIDWTYGSRGAMSFAWELRDLGQYGFVLPADQILPTCKENLGAQLYLADRFSAPVRFELPAELPYTLPPLTPATVDVNIFGGIEPLNTATPAVHYRLDPAAPFATAALSNVGGDTYRATLPAAACGTQIEFYFSASGTDGTVNADPLGAPQKVHSILAAGTNVVLADDFEADMGWTVVDTAPVSGAWVRVAPIGTTVGSTQAQPATDNPAGAGTVCFVTGQGAVGGAANAADLDNGPTRLVSPRLDLSGGEARISYYRWFYCNNDNDTLDVDISNNDGASWTRVETVRTTPRWLLRRIMAADYVMPTSQMRLRFSTQDAGNNSTTEAAVDDLRVEVRSPGSVQGDFNCSGTVDVGDVLPFAEVLLGLANEPARRQRADVNGDGAADARDIQKFVHTLLVP